MPKPINFRSALRGSGRLLGVGPSFMGARPFAALVPISADLGVTEADDTVSAAAALLIQASAALSEAADSISAADVELVTGAAALVEANDVLAAVDADLVTVTAQLVEDGDTVLAADVELVAITASLLEDGDTLLADAHVPMGDATANAALLEDEDLVFADAANPDRVGGAWLGLQFRPIAVPYGKPRYYPPARARAKLREEDDGALSEGSVFWPSRSRAVREEEWLLRRAA